jgi:hypothetical protein
MTHRRYVVGLLSPCVQSSLPNVHPITGQKTSSITSSTTLFLPDLLQVRHFPLANGSGTNSCVLGAVAKGAAGLNQHAGALGLGSVDASALTNLFTFLAYVIPIFGAIVADTRWGRFKTICVGEYFSSAKLDVF